MGGNGIITDNLFCQKCCKEKEGDTEDNNYGMEWMCLGMCFGTALGTALGNNTGLAAIDFPPLTLVGVVGTFRHLAGKDRGVSGIEVNGGIVNFNKFDFSVIRCDGFYCRNK